MSGFLKRALGELLSPAMIVALMALTLSVGGTAYAAKLITSKDIKNNTVTSRDLKNGGVRAADLKNGTVGSVDVKNGSIRGVDLADGTVGSGDIADGTVGSGDIADGSIGSGDIADGSIGLEDLDDTLKFVVGSNWEPSQRLIGGRTITGAVTFVLTGTAGDELFQTIAFPARAPVSAFSANFAPDASAVTTDDDVRCTGTYTAPTAPPGRICAYRGGSLNVAALSIDTLSPGGDKGFVVSALAVAAGQTTVEFSWAYTAPGN